MTWRERARDWRPDWPAIVGLYALALALRIAQVGIPLYGDEAWHFYAARLFGRDADHIHLMEQEQGFDLSLMFWWRPLFEILLAPGAWIGFTAYRLEHIVLASTAAPLAYLVVRDGGGRRLAAAAAAIAVATHPVFVRWGVIVFPDGLLTVFVLAALWAWIRGWGVASAVLAVGAAWTKEVGAIAVAALALLECARRWRSKELRLRPLRVPRSLIAFAVAAPLSIAPVWWYVVDGGRPPGWNRGGNPDFVLDQLVLYPWLAPILLAGLFLPRSRPLAVVALAYASFWLATHFWLGRELQGWYFVLPSALAVVAVAATLDEAHERLRRRTMPLPQAAIALAATLLLVGAVDVLAPRDEGWKGEMTQPFTHAARLSLLETMEDDRKRVRDEDVLDLERNLAPADRGTLLLIDYPWFNIFYPMGDAAQEIRYGYTGWFDEYETGEEVWAGIIEERADATVVYTSWDVGPFHRAVLEAYDACVAYRNPSYVLLRGEGCDVGPIELRATYERHKAEAEPA